MTTTGAVSQLRALFGLRWQMVRSGTARAGLLLALLCVLWLMLLVARGTSGLDSLQASTAVDLAPEVFLGFGILAIVAPLTAGGGNEILPPEQLVAFPVRPRTQFVGGLLLAPINLVWVLQILALIAETVLLAGTGNRWLPALTTAVFVLAVTCLGQALAWFVVGLRQSRRGRVGVFLLTAAVVGAVLVVLASHVGGRVLDASPTRAVVAAIRAGARGDDATWAVTMAVLILLMLLALRLGEVTCGWAIRQPSDAGAMRATRIVRRRRPYARPLRALVAMDRASVWRAPALRRGGLVLALLPGVATAGIKVPWPSLVVMPGLVAAGAGLLFGINAFSLDGSGALFLASLPHDPRLIARAKLLVITETVLGAVTVAAVTGSLRSPGSPTPAVLAAIVASGLACTAIVVSGGMAASVRRPHQAGLNGPRDAVAPPGALVIASARLALPAAAVGAVLETSAQPGVWWLPLSLAAVVMLLCWLSLIRSFRTWADPLVRARIVQTVSAG